MEATAWVRLLLELVNGREMLRSGFHCGCGIVLSVKVILCGSGVGQGGLEIESSQVEVRLGPRENVVGGTPRGGN